MQKRLTVVAPEPIAVVGANAPLLRPPCQRLNQAAIGIDAKIAVAQGYCFPGDMRFDFAAKQSAGPIYPAIELTGKPVDLLPIRVFDDGDTLQREIEQSQLPWCVEHDLTVCVNEANTVRQLARIAAAAGKRAPVHLKIHTGMSRYGVRWDEATPLVKLISSEKSLQLAGAMTHFAQSDETDKGFALLQLERFREVLRGIEQAGLRVKLRHLCNSGGFLDLPQAHFDMARLGILPLGVYPSAVCRRIPGIEPVMSVKARIAAIQKLEPGDSAGYGMRYTAASPRRLAVLPIGYGDGFPRVRNQGCALIHGRRAPLIGGVAMDAAMVDITDIPEARLWDEAVLMGRQGSEEINVHEVAKLKGSVSYDVLTSWRARLPRIYKS